MLKQARAFRSPAAGSRRRRHGEAYLHRPKRSFRKSRPAGNGSRAPYALIAVCCAFLFFVASIIWYANRGVEITLNGESTTVRVGETVEQLIDDQELADGLKAGNLLAVDDSVLKKGGGDAYSVELNGSTLAIGDVASTKLSGGEKLKVSDGADIYEAHDVTASDIEPTLSMTGDGPVQYVKTWGVKGRSEIWTGKESGRRADRGVVKQPVNCEVECVSVKPDNGRKCVALTFNEGPSAHTRQMLDILEQQGAKATFFLTGEGIEANPDAAKAIADSGNEIGSNSYAFERLSKLKGDALRSQLSRGFDAIESATGEKCALLRAPYASFSAQNWADSMDMVSAMVGWNIDSGDWLLKGAKSVTDTVIGSVQPGSIIFLTDNSSVSAQTAASLPALIDGLKAQGYELLTLSDLVATDKELAAGLDLSQVSKPEDAVLPRVPAEQGRK
ncbi:polysaccharide deacetylase family protein [Coriobacterium glomerans]|uniref:polysaccharide deacetylase family protein n=1 Tax=Coriobacterium glomerans TaxID=33871 RepID=UPI001FE195DF|nr:polysaccharide deacetylase family protein [Coriobacterium glomerans]